MFGSSTQRSGRDHHDLGRERRGATLRSLLRAFERFALGWRGMIFTSSHQRFLGGGRGGIPSLVSTIRSPVKSKSLDKSGSLPLSRANPQSRGDASNFTSLYEPLECIRPVGIDYRDVILVQAFTWESAQSQNWYRHVREAIPLLREYHVTHVWLPPASQSLDRQGYLPQALYDLNSSSYGTFEELRDLNRDLCASSMRPVADIVMNHRCPDGQDENGIWNQYRDEMDHPGATLQWDTSAVASDDPIWPGVGGKDTGKDYEAAPDLDHTNPLVVDGLTDWLSWMRSHVGFEGACQNLSYSTLRCAALTL